MINPNTKALTSEQGRELHTERMENAAAEMTQCLSQFLRASAAMTKSISAPIPTERTITEHVHPGEPGYDDLPPVTQMSDNHGDFKWINQSHT